MLSKDRFCNLFEPCETPEAPLCPLQEKAQRGAIWYGDEPVCQSELFQNLPWVKKQKSISGLGLKADDGFFTVRMLESLGAISKDTKGADPDDPGSEKIWLNLRQVRHQKSTKNISNKHRAKKHLKLADKQHLKRLC